jgi:aryl-alcohol dehydrogenase-like predicted oxidoreductase
MQQRPLGQTGLIVSELGFGCASWWGKPAFDEDRAIGLVQMAVDLGITFFDTGASYASGQAEPRLGRALKGLPRGRLVIATKAGTYHAGGGRIARDFSPAAIVASAEASLERLGLSEIDLLQLHGPAVEELTPELVAVLEDLKVRGLVRALGVNSFDPPVVEHVIGLPQFDVVMVDYNVLRPEREPLIERAAKAGKGVLAGMALAMGHTQGALTRLKAPQDLWYAARGLARHRDELKRGQAFRFLHEQPDMTGSQAALSYVLASRHVSCAVFGTTRPSHLKENAAASGMPLPPALKAKIRAAQSLVR